MFLFEEFYYSCCWRACYRRIYWNMSYNDQSIIRGNHFVRLFGLRARLRLGPNCKSSDVVLTMGAINFRMPSKFDGAQNLKIHFLAVTALGLKYLATLKSFVHRDREKRQTTEGNVLRIP